VAGKTVLKPKLRRGRLQSSILLVLVLLVAFAVFTTSLMNTITQNHQPQTGASTSSVSPSSTATNTAVSTSSSSATLPYTHPGTTTTPNVKPPSNLSDASFVKPIQSYDELMSMINSGATRYYSLNSFVMRAVAQAGIKVPVPVTTALITTTATTTAGGSTPEYSHTNVQVAGVDEADIVKTDGKYIYLVGRSSLIKTQKGTYVQKTPIYIILAYPPNGMSVVSEFEVLGSVNGIFISNDKLIVINSSSAYYYRVIKPLVTPTTPPTPATVTVTTTLVPTPPIPIMRPVRNTTILVYDVGNRKQPILKYKDSVSGWVLAARMIGDKVYLITLVRNDIITIYASRGKSSVVVPTINGKVMPPYKIMYVTLKNIMPYSNGYVIIAGLNLRDGAFDAKAYVMPYPNRIYVSKDSVYLLSNWWTYFEVVLDVIKNAVLPSLPHDVAARINTTLSNTSLPIYARLARAGEVLEEYTKNAPKEDLIKLFVNTYKYIEKNVTGRSLTVTHIFKLKLEGLTAIMVAHAKIDGRVMDQFAMDEREGYFRVATTATIIKKFKVAGYSESLIPIIMPVYEDVNNVYVLNATNLKVVGKLEGLEPGEKVYAARYVGKYLYLVTFRRIDPLFAIDLSNPRNPRVIGFVKMPGFSEYLHPYKDRYLIGIGLSTDGNGVVRGLKISLYDVSNPRNITEASVVEIKGGWSTSQVLWDHRAFLINPTKGYLCIPIVIYGEGKVSGYLYIIRISNDGKLSVAGKVQHPGVLRSLYIGNYLYTISRALIKSIDLSTMKVVSTVKLSS